MPTPGKRGSKNFPRNSSQQNKDRARIRATKAACYICGQPIDYTIPYRDPDTLTVNPMSFTVDHVRAYSKGGADNLTNKKAAHAKCNNMKRARDYAPIVRRSGSLG